MHNYYNFILHLYQVKRTELVNIHTQHTSDLFISMGWTYI